MPRLLRRTLSNPLFFAILTSLFIVSMCAVAPESVSVLGALVLHPDSRLTAAQARTGCVYWVRPGDNLFRIGIRYGVSYRYLASLNGIPNPNLIFAGTPLAVPCAPNPRPIPTPANCAPSLTYTVQPGNNLFRIALAYGSLVEWIRSANNLYGRVLRPGMELTVPCPGSVQYGPVPEPPAGVATVAPPGEVVTPETTPATAVPPPTGTTPTTPAPPTSNSIVVKIFADHFEPNSATIKAGTNVAWTNQDTNAHIIACPECAPNALFNSPANQHTVQPNEIYQYTFSNIGTYDIILQDNQNAKISITVVPSQGTPSP